METQIIPAPNNMSAPRITRDQIDKLMERIEYRFDQPRGTTSTFCHAFLRGESGRMFFLATGHSACVSIENFNLAIGQDLARAKATHQAYDKLWELEGYALFKELNDAK